MNKRDIRLAYEVDREAALRALRDAGIQYKEAHKEVDLSSIEIWQQTQADFKSMLIAITNDVVRMLGNVASRTAIEVVGRGGFGQVGDKLASMIGEAVGKGIGSALSGGEGWRKNLGEVGGKLGAVGAQAAVGTFAWYESQRMLGARRAPMMGGAPTGEENFFQMGRQYTAQSIEIRQITGASTQAVDDLMTELSRVGIKFDDTGKEATKYALSAQTLLNLQEGMVKDLQVTAVKDYGEAWGDVTDIIHDTTAVSQYWQAVAEKTGDAQARALSSNQVLLDMYVKIMQATKGTSFSMTGLNALFLASTDTMRKMGLRPEMITSLTGEFISKIAPQTGGLQETVMQGFFLRDLLRRSEGGRRLMSVAMGVAEQEGIDPLMSNIALSVVLSRDKNATELLGTSVLEGILEARSEMPGHDRGEQNMLMVYKMQAMMGLSPMAGHLAVTLAEEYKKNLNKGLSPEAALRQAGMQDVVQDMAGVLGFKGLSGDEIIERLTPIGKAMFSTEERLKMATERMVAIHDPSVFWPQMTDSIAAGMKRVAQGTASALGPSAAEAAELPPIFADALPFAMERDTTLVEGLGIGRGKQRGRNKHIVSSYFKSGAGGVQQVNMSVDESYFGENIADIASAIAQVETGGKQAPYSAVGARSSKGDRPYGKYQVMGANIPSWTKEALGEKMTPGEFLRNPEAQEKVARHKMAQYYARYGNVGDVAAMWHAGVPLSVAISQKRRDVLGTKTSNYAQKIEGYVAARRMRG